MNLFPSRGGWPFTGPPNCDFELNTNSPQAQGLVAWWPTLASRGGVLRDYVTNRNCTISGASLEVSSQVGRALNFSANTDYARLASASAAPYSTDIKTIAGWIRPGWSSAATNKLWCGVRDAGGTSWSLYIGSTLGLIGCWDGGNWGTITHNFTQSSRQHVVFQFNASITLYVNGRYIGDRDAGAEPLPSGGAHNFNIGGASEWNVDETFEGDIGETRLYDRLLTAAEVWSLYAPQTRWELYRPLVPHFPGVTLAAGGVDVSLDTLALTGAAQGMTVSPGAVNVALDALGLTAAAQSLTVQAVTTIALDALALVGAAQGLTVSPGEATTALDLLTLTGAAQGLTVSSGAVSVALDALGLTATAQGLTVSPGAVSVVLDALGLSASAETITISSGVIVALNALALSIQAESLGVSPGAVAVELASLGLTGAAQGLDILPGAVTIALDALTLASAAGPLTVSAGIRVALDALALTGTVLGTTVEPGAVGVSLDALNLTAAILALSIAAGADMIDVDVSDALVWGAAVADALLYHVEVSDTSRE